MLIMLTCNSCATAGKMNNVLRFRKAQMSFIQLHVPSWKMCSTTTAWCAGSPGRVTKYVKHSSKNVLQVVEGGFQELHVTVKKAPGWSLENTKWRFHHFLSCHSSPALTPLRNLSQSVSQPGRRCVLIPDGQFPGRMRAAGGDDLNNRWNQWRH